MTASAGANRTRLVSLAAGTILDIGPAEAVEVAAAAGWPAVGIWFDPASWTPSRSQEVRQRLDDTGVVALDIEPVILGPDGDPGEALIEAAVAIGARHVLVASRLADHAKVTDRFGALCDLAAGTDVKVVLEFLPIFGVRTLIEACTIVRACGRANAGVLVDSLHLARSGSGPVDLRAVEAHLLPYLQLCDAPAVAPDTSLGGLVEEALHGRSLLGDGGLPVAAVLDAVPDVPVSFELRSRALNVAHPDPVERAAAVLRNWREFSER